MIAEALRELELKSINDVAYRVIADSGVPAAGVVISVIVPTRNRADMVRQTVEALLRQDFDYPYEVIVVDNHSSDDTRHVLAGIAERAKLPFRGVEMDRDRGPAVSRNVGLSLARGEYVAFTDSDCLPAKGWLAGLYRRLSSGAVAVQGKTVPPPWQPQPFFSHFIETLKLDGSFSTSNVAYRREALVAAGGFDPACDYWEDVDLGWRVVRGGRQYVFAPQALVYHQVIRQTPLQWLQHATRMGNWPQKAARYPEFRRHLFLGIWVDQLHALFTLFVLGLTLGRLRKAGLLLTLPYLIAFPMKRGLRGKAPPLKALAHFAHDCIAFGSLLIGSVRSKSIVL